jgi:hypothetical protein
VEKGSSSKVAIGKWSSARGLQWRPVANRTGVGNGVLAREWPWPFIGGSLLPLGVLARAKGGGARPRAAACPAGRSQARANGDTARGTRVFKAPRSNPGLGARGLGMRPVGPDAEDRRSARRRAGVRDVAFRRRFISVYPVSTEFISKFCN